MSRQGQEPKMASTEAGTKREVKEEATKRNRLVQTNPHGGRQSDELPVERHLLKTTSIPYG